MAWAGARGAGGTDIDKVTAAALGSAGAALACASEDPIAVRLRPRGSLEMPALLLAASALGCLCGFRCVHFPSI